MPHPVRGGCRADRGGRISAGRTRGPGRSIIERLVAALTATWRGIRDRFDTVAPSRTPAAHHCRCDPRIRVLADGTALGKEPGRSRRVDVCRPLTSRCGEPGQAGPRVVPLVLEGITIGRRPECDLVIRGGAVTSRHARIELIAGEWCVRDVGSTSGTPPRARRPINVGNTRCMIVTNCDWDGRVSSSASVKVRQSPR